jgi:hypothetical protein
VSYDFVKLTLGVLCIFGLYSILYRETKFYRFFEHLFLGLAAGFAFVWMWTDPLKTLWWDRMVGATAENGQAGTPGYWMWALLLPMGLMAYFVYHEKHGWMARVPIGAILGLWAGQQVQVWWNLYGPQIDKSIRPIIPNTFDSFFVPSTEGLAPEAVKQIAENTYASEAINNLIFVVVLISVLSYFIFSIEYRSRFLKGMTVMGRWSLMVGFGAIFGSTVMMRFSLLIDRMYFVWIEWLNDTVLRSFGGG